MFKKYFHQYRYAQHNQANESNIDLVLRLHPFCLQNNCEFDNKRDIFTFSGKISD